MTVLSPTPHAIAAAARTLRDGGLVGMPTETVYGLAADATNPDAVLSIYATKQRPRFNPLIVHVAAPADAFRLGHETTSATALVARFWPGPLTIVVPARADNGVADVVTAGLDTIALRCPAHHVARALIQAAGRPLAAPSANRSGRLSPTTANDVAGEFSDDLVILDGGPCDRGVESTIVDMTTSNPRLLRAGSITTAEIEAVLGTALVRPVLDPTCPSAPGQLESHYAPRARMRLGASQVEPGEGLLSFGRDPPSAHGPVVNLSPSADLLEAARNLFSALRQLDRTGVPVIAVMSVPDTGLGEAINDRLRRAAAPRPPNLI